MKTKSTLATWRKFVKHFPRIIMILCYSFQTMSKEAENFLKQTIIQVLSAAQNAYVKLMTVSYPDNFLRAETNKSTTGSIPVTGETMQSLMNNKTTEGVGCNFICAWDYEERNPLGTSLGTEKASFFSSVRSSLTNQTRTVQRQHIVLYRPSAKKE